MGIVLIILQIISAIPTIISVVREIIRLIKGLPKAERGGAFERLLNIAKRAKADRLVSPDQARELHGFLEELRRRRAERQAGK